MGWFGNIMDNWFGMDPPDNSAATAQTAALQQQTASAKASADAALKAQTDANLIAAAAAVPQTDSEGARASSDAQKRKLMAGSSFGIGLPSQLGAPPVGFRMLSGQ
jgi:hypothetical protein